MKKGRFKNCKEAINSWEKEAKKAIKKKDVLGYNFAQQYVQAFKWYKIFEEKEGKK